MPRDFKFELIKPDELVFSSKVIEAKIPCFEGEMTILPDHIPIITFLRPGIIEIKSYDKDEKYYIEEGTVEFNNNNLLILSSTTFNLKNIPVRFIEDNISETEKKLNDHNLNDKQKFLLSYKFETLKSIN